MADQPSLRVGLPAGSRRRAGGSCRSSARIHRHDGLLGERLRRPRIRRLVRALTELARRRGLGDRSALGNSGLQAGTFDLVGALERRRRRCCRDATWSTYYPDPMVTADVQLVPRGGARRRRGAGPTGPGGGDVGAAGGQGWRGDGHGTTRRWRSPRAPTCPRPACSTHFGTCGEPRCAWTGAETHRSGDDLAVGAAGGHGAARRGMQQRRGHDTASENTDDPAVRTASRWTPRSAPRRSSCWLTWLSRSTSRTRPLIDGECVFVDVRSKSSGAATTAFAEGWDEAVDGPAGHLVPGRQLLGCRSSTSDSRMPARLRSRRRTRLRSCSRRW